MCMCLCFPCNAHESNKRPFRSWHSYVDDRDDPVSYNEKATPTAAIRALSVDAGPQSPSLLPHTVMLIGETDGGRTLAVASAVKHGVVDGEEQNPRLSPARIRMRRPSLGSAIDLPPLPPPALSSDGAEDPSASQKMATSLSGGGATARGAEGGAAARVFR